MLSNQYKTRTNGPHQRLHPRTSSFSCAIMRFYICYTILTHPSVDDLTGIGIRHTKTLSGNRWHDRQVGISRPGEHFPDHRRHLARHDDTHILCPWRACHDRQIKFSNPTAVRPLSTHRLTGWYPAITSVTHKCIRDIFSNYNLRQNCIAIHI